MDQQFSLSDIVEDALKTYKGSYDDLVGSSDLVQMETHVIVRHFRSSNKLQGYLQFSHRLPFEFFVKGEAISCVDAMLLHALTVNPLYSTYEKRRQEDNNPRKLRRVHSKFEFNPKNHLQFNSFIKMGRYKPQGILHTKVVERSEVDKLLNISNQGEAERAWEVHFQKAEALARELNKTAPPVKHKQKRPRGRRSDNPSS
jgi:hypothetical protein